VVGRSSTGTTIRAPVVLAPQHGSRRDVIEVEGSIEVDTLWNADLVKVIGNVIVEDDVTLTVAPGVVVEFQGYFRLDVAGTILAIGTPDQRIVFTTDEPESFAVDASRTGCWNGIRFENTPAMNAPSQLTYCVVEYSKALTDDDRPYAYGGGAISIIDYADVTIENCILRHNVADYGGALFLYRHGNPRVAGNLITENHALANAAAVYAAYSHPDFVNNTIVENAIHNGDDPYIETCAALSFISKPRFANNIIRGNDPEVFYAHSQLWHNKDYYTRSNNIEGYEAVNGNIDADPRFVDPGRNDYRISAGSPCIDAGDNRRVPDALTADLDGNPRRVDDPATDDTGIGEPPIVDMGAYEFGADDCPADLTDDGVVNVDDLFVVLNRWGEIGGDADINADGIVDINDLFEVLLAWGPCSRSSRPIRYPVRGR
jgi:hypothetical protein